jgi:DNA replication and repair protein RecF
LRLLHVGARDFRNLAPFRLGLDARFVIVHGENGHGKTNLLEAIYVLATLRPLRGARLKDAVAWGAVGAVIEGASRSGGGPRALKVELGDERRTFLDGSACRDLDAYFDEIRAIAFTPSDAAILTEGPEHRRAWLDRAAFTASPSHLGVVRTCQRILAQKGAALRQLRPDPDLLDALDVQLARAGAELTARRAALLDELRPHIEAVHARIAGAPGALRFQIRTQAEGATPSQRAEGLGERLQRLRAEELRRRTCLAGPQRDDMVVLLDGQPARTFASRGQTRSIVLGLKLAELEAARVRGQAPLFLLDDLSSELDAGRTARLIERLRELDAHVVVTTTDPELLAGMTDGDAQRVRVVSGQLQA